MMCPPSEWAKISSGASDPAMSLEPRDAACDTGVGSGDRWRVLGGLPQLVGEAGVIGVEGAVARPAIGRRIGQPVHDEIAHPAPRAQVSPEFLQCQIEIGTRSAPHRRRRAPRICAACAHGPRPPPPSSASRPSPPPATPSPLARPASHRQATATTGSERDLGGVAQRMLICGMHVHVGVDDDEDLRIDLMNQADYFLPHLLALSVPRRSGKARTPGWPPTG
jgi:hypothetical protein